MNDWDEQKEYEGRADFIADEDLLNWTVDNKHFEDVQKKLSGRNSVLIAGPRGSGKTHQMKLVYNRCLHDPMKPMAVYVTYGKYYHLEPFLFKESNAISIFHTWVLGKIVLGCYQFLKDSKKESSYEDIEEFGPVDDLTEFVSRLEKGLKEDNDWVAKITIQSVIRFLERVSLKLCRKRVILLLDDAALTLTPEYMKEFFDVFRGLRTREISPKASVYPGTTEYGPGFHLGHDAEKVGIWFNPEAPDCNYKEFMDELVNKRLPDVRNEIPAEMIELFKYASFGIPRAFISLVRSYLEKEGKNQQERFNKVIDDHAELIKSGYLSLGKKMAQYKNIIRIGGEFFDGIVNLITEENRKLLKDENKLEKQIFIGINREKSIKFSRMIKFLNEAGLLYEFPPVRHGDDREYDRYMPHLLFLIKNRAFIIKRGFDPKKVLEVILRKPAKHPVRRGFNTLLNEDQVNSIKLDLPPCSNCGAERLTEGQLFCHNCGVELVEKSRFESCIKFKIEDLPIPPGIKKRIKDDTHFKTIEDIVASQAPGSELQQANYIGPKRSKKVLDIVIKTVEEFLS